METKKSLLSTVLETLVQLLCVLDLSKLKLIMKSNPKIYIAFAIVKLLVLVIISTQVKEKNELKQSV